MPSGRLGTRGVPALVEAARGGGGPDWQQPGDPGAVHREILGRGGTEWRGRHVLP